ncbi:MAG: PIN domain-containing protein [Planctomycetaceae bacterium]|nr:PIN domain-containing protein [Planctomycetaceae bacterium]
MRKIRVYLDNCCYNRPFDDQNQIRIFLETQAKIHIQNLIICERLELVYSYMSIFENSKNPNKDNSRIIDDFFVHAAVFVDYNKEEIVGKAAERIKAQGIKNKDAIHLASAIEAECDYFITTDDVILKKNAEKSIKVCSPIEFITLYEAKNA